MGVAQTLLLLAERADCCDHFRLERSSGLLYPVASTSDATGSGHSAFAWPHCPSFPLFFYWHLSAVDSASLASARPARDVGYRTPPKRVALRRGAPCGCQRSSEGAGKRFFWSSRMATCMHSIVALM